MSRANAQECADRLATNCNRTAVALREMDRSQMLLDSFPKSRRSAWHVQRIERCGRMLDRLAARFPKCLAARIASVSR